MQEVVKKYVAEMAGESQHKFLFLGDLWEIWAERDLPTREPIERWFTKFFHMSRRLWRDATAVVYVMEVGDKLTFHIAVSRDEPVLALAVQGESMSWMKASNQVVEVLLDAVEAHPD